MKIAPYIVIIILMAILMLQRTCKTEMTCPECDEFDTTAFIQTLPIKYKDTTVYVPKPYTVYKDTGKIIKVEVPADIDSFAIATAYFSESIITDTILNDTNGIIVVNDVISENEIKERYIYPKTLYPHYKIVTGTIGEDYEEKIKLFAGFGVIGGVNRFGFSANILLKTKKDAAYGLSYDIINKDIAFSMYWKLKLKR